MVTGNGVTVQRVLKVRYENVDEYFFDAEHTVAIRFSRQIIQKSRKKAGKYSITHLYKTIHKTQLHFTQLCGKR
jgi:hypothetical protein